MKRGNILAHRGFWNDPASRNSRAALSLAIDNGFGVETDLRDSGMRLWISHDPVPERGGLPAERFLADWGQTAGAPRLALNIKSDGLQTLIAEAIAATGVQMRDTFVFDMSVPDTLGYLRSGMPIYTRASEHEPDPPFVAEAQGVWVDSFTGTYPQVRRAAEFLERGLRVAVVSPELHGRPHEDLWNDILRARLHDNEAFEICTDFPDAAHRLFGSD